MKNNSQKKHKLLWKKFWEACYTGDYMACYDLHRLIGYPFYYFGVNQGIKANYFTLLAFFFRFISCFFFISEIYVFRLIGLAFLNLGLAVDCIDGPLARYQKGTSKLGEWLASQLIALKTIIVWSSICYGTYISENDPNILLNGLIIIGHLFFAYHLEREKNRFKINQKGAVTYGPKKHNKIGLEFALDAIIFIFVALNQNFLLFEIMVYILAIPWLILFRQGIKSF